MDIRQLRYFVALAEELHFGRAAARLHIAQPALSQQIRSLESGLGLRLVERTSRGIVLTDAGTRLLAEARGVVGRFDEAVETMRRVREGALAVLRVGVFPGPLRAILPAALAELRRRRPEVDVETRFLRPEEQVAALRDARLDLALLPSLGDPELSTPLSGREVAREPLGMAVPAVSALAQKDVLEAADLGPLPLVFMSRASAPRVYETVLSALQGAGVRPRSLLEASSPESSLSIVAAGLGVSVKTESEVAAARAAGDHVTWRRLRGFDLELAIVAVWDTRRITPPLRLLVDVLADKRWLSGEKEAVLDAGRSARSTGEVSDTGASDGD